jgi:hypothetical protein
MAWVEAAVFRAQFSKLGEIKVKNITVNTDSIPVAGGYLGIYPSRAMVVKCCSPAAEAILCFLNLPASDLASTG